METRSYTSSRLTSCSRDSFYFSDTASEIGWASSTGHLTYTGQLEDYISRYKRRPPDIKYWPYGPYWPRHFDGLLLNTPRLLSVSPSETEPLLRGDIGRRVNATSQTCDNQVTPYKGRWRGIQVSYDSERSSRNFNPLPVPEGCCPSLMFESRFECGNLRQARRVGHYEYELVLRTDLYTARHTQWYYFRVTNTVPGVTYKFRIVNLLKRDSLYNHGMRPLVYSENDAREKQRGWVRTGHHISYSRNFTNHNCPLLARGITYHMLEWQMEFANADDTYYLAHCYPYSFTDLKEDLEVLMNSEERSQVTRREVMCETRAGNSCFLLTVTNFDVTEEKKAVVITGRVHPGESQASWMMKGLLEYITGPDPVAQELRKKFVFKIVPMINPDGVIVGNYRCSLAARDLNRNYRHPRRENFPTIWYLKNMVEDLSKKHEVSLYCDLHGHSRKANVFMYGNNSSSEGETSPLGMARAFISERLFPWLMSLRSPDKFHFRSCKFHIRRCKESTGRVVMWRQMKIFNSFTLEATFSGTVIDRDHCRHFNILDLMEMGKVLAQSVMDYHDVQEDQAQQTKTVLDLTKVITEQILTSRGIIEPETSLPDFIVDKEIMEANPLKVQESAEKWTGALLMLLNTPRTLPVRQPATASEAKGRSQEESKEAAQRGGTGDETSEPPTYTREDVAEMLNRLVTGQSMDECLGLLAQLDVQDAIEESDSSDSDSESEPEMKPIEPKVRKKKRKSKKQRDKDSEKKLSGGTGEKRVIDEIKVKALSGPSASPGAISASSRQGGSNSCSAHSDLSVMGLGKQNQANMDRYRASRQMSGFISKYQGRHNGGVPCFTEERSMERAAKRMAELRKKDEDDRNRDMTYFCVEDPDSQRYSHEELISQRLHELNETGSHNIPSALLGVNVRTGYTHADNLQDMSPVAAQPLNGVNSYLMSTLHASGYHHGVADLQEPSSSEVSDEEFTADPGIKFNLNNSSSNHGVGDVFSISKESGDIQSFKDSNNHSNIHCKGHNNNHSSDRSNNYTNSQHTRNSGSGGGGGGGSCGGTGVGGCGGDGGSSDSSAMAFLPLTARRNPYHSLDPLEWTRSPSLLSLVQTSHGGPGTMTPTAVMAGQELMAITPMVTSHPAAMTTPRAATTMTMMTTSIKPSDTTFIGSSTKSPTRLPRDVQAIVEFPSSSSTSSSPPPLPSSSSPSAISSLSSSAPTIPPSSSLPSSQKMSTTAPLVPVHRTKQQDRNGSLAHNGKIDRKSGTIGLLKQLRNHNRLGHISPSSNINKSNNYNNNNNSNNNDNSSNNNNDKDGLSTVNGYSKNKCPRPLLASGDAPDPRLVAQPIAGWPEGLRGCHLDMSPQNVGQLVHQLSQNLTCTSASVSGSGITKRHIRYKNSHLRSLSRSSAAMTTPSPLMTSGLAPTNRIVLPDHIAHRVDDRNRFGARSSNSDMIPRLHPAPTLRQGFHWE